MAEFPRRRKASHEPHRGDVEDRRKFDWRPRSTFELLKLTAQEWVEDKCPKQAAALAYYTLFALGPLLLLAISIAGLLFGAEAARAAVMGEMGRLLGPTGSEAVGELLAGATRERAGIIGTVVGLGLLVFAAGGVFAQLKEALNRAWEVQPKKVKGWKAKVGQALRKNFASFAGIVGTGFLLLVSLLVSAVLAAVGRYLEGLLPGTALLWQVVNLALSLVVVTLAFAAIYKFLPDVRVAWRDVLLGALVTAALFLAGQVAIGYYLGAGGLSTRYGAASAVIVILVWVYYSSLIAFFGAEFTQVYANLYGSRVRASDDARPLAQAVVEEQAPPHREGLDKRKGNQGRGAA